MIRIELDKHLNGRSLHWLSTETGIRWATLDGMLKGKARRLELPALEKLCSALECNPGDLLVIQRRAKAK